MPQISNLLSDPRNIALLQALQEDPRQPVTRLASRVGMSAPAVKERLQGLGANVVPANQRTPEYLGSFVKAEIEKWYPIIKAADIKLE